MTFSKLESYAYVYQCMYFYVCIYFKCIFCFTNLLLEKFVMVLGRRASYVCTWNTKYLNTSVCSDLEYYYSCDQQKTKSRRAGRRIWVFGRREFDPDSYGRSETNNNIVLPTVIAARGLATSQKRHRSRPLSYGRRHYI